MIFTDMADKYVSDYNYGFVNQPLYVAGYSEFTPIVYTLRVASPFFTKASDDCFYNDLTDVWFYSDSGDLIWVSYNTDSGDITFHLETHFLWRDLSDWKICPSAPKWLSELLSPIDPEPCESC